MKKQLENITWHCKSYDSLTLDQFHDVIALRIKIFIIEQDSIVVEELPDND